MGRWPHADQRRAEKIIEKLCLIKASSVSTPSVKDRNEEPDDEDPLEDWEAKEFREIAARANYLAVDRPDIQYSVKEICRHMSCPFRGDARKLKRLGRYLVGHSRVVMRFPFQREPEHLTILADANHAGCLRTRRSTSGGAVMYGQCLLKSWSSTQAVVALSSGESEYYALVKAASEGLGIRSALGEWGEDKAVHVYTDSTAAKGIASRQGLNKRTRHVAVHLLWVQEKVANKELHLWKIDGKANAADLGTKELDQQGIMKCMTRLGAVVMSGRHKLAPV